MHRFTSYIAILLLLLFTRAMVPDTLFLELHSHSHTLHTGHTDSHEAQVGQKHKHCPVEDIFEASFHGSITNIDFVQLLPATAYFSYYQSNWHSNSTSYSYLRGPPVA